MSKSTRPEVERALLRVGSTPSAEETQRFYALRVSDYGRALTMVFVGLYVAGIFLVLALIPRHFWAFHLHPAKLANLGFAVTSGAIWRLTRRVDCPAWLVTTSDVALPMSVAIVIAIAGVAAPAGYGLFFFPLLIGALVLMLRAAIVPSPPRRTAVVGVLASIPILWTCRTIALGEPNLLPPMTPNALAFASAAWCCALVAATTLTSKVIYGLHHEIRTAKRLGQYVLGDLIGEGGMGAVYRAEHAMLRRPTAVKLILPERAGSANIARFEREVQLTARLTHPNTVAIYDYGRTPDGIFYYAMEYLDGVSLEELVKRYGPQPAGRVIHVLLQASGALAEAHSLGLIHRDVKPANILFCERGGAPDTVKLVDFGLVKDLAPSGGPELTHTDAITGTPQYLAPESIADPSSIDHRVDLYALGGVAYYLLTGHPPFEGMTVLEVCGHHLHTPPEPPSERLGAPILAELEALVLRCLAKKPDDRPADAQALQDALLECARKAPWARSEAHAWWRDFRLGSLPQARARAAS